MIIDRSPPDCAPQTPLDLLWEFLELAPFVMSRVDDSKRPNVGAVFFDARERDSARLRPVPAGPIPLAERTWGGGATNMRWVRSPRSSRGMARRLRTGMAHLKSLIHQFESAPLDATDDHPALAKFLA